jgi:hypothetical protein
VEVIGESTPTGPALDDRVEPIVLSIATAPRRSTMRPTRSMLALSTAILAAGASSLEARADGSALGRDCPAEPFTGAPVLKDGVEEHVSRLFAQPLAAKLATAAVGAPAGGTSRVTSKVTFNNGNTDAEADVEIDLDY